MDIGAVGHLTAQCSETFWKHICSILEKKKINPPFLVYNNTTFSVHQSFDNFLTFMHFSNYYFLNILENVSLCCAVECATASISIYDFSIIISSVGSVRSVLCSGLKRCRVQHFQCSSHLTFFFTLLLTTTCLGA